MGLTEHYNNYLRVGNSDIGLSFKTEFNSAGDYYTWGYTCPICGCWVSGNSRCSYCYPGFNYVPQYQNKTEQAYQLLKKFIEKKIISEPQSYKEFCSTLEAIRDSL